MINIDIKIEWSKYSMKNSTFKSLWERRKEKGNRKWKYKEKEK